MTTAARTKAWLAISLALATALAGCTSGPQPGPVGGANGAGTGEPGAGTARVDIRDIQFQPADLTVAVGTTVTWTNHDPSPHTVTPADKALWGSEGSGDAATQWLGENATWSFTFTKPGTFPYYCKLHAAKTAEGAWRGQMPNATVVPNPIAPARTLPGADGVVHLTLETKEVVAQLADGAAYGFWTFGGTVPGPMLRVREGETVEVTLRNPADSAHPHSVDLHAVTGPGGGGAATQANPGEDKAFRWKPLNPGLYVYHCATPYVPEHIANGMYGLILVEPKEGLPVVDREFYVMQGEVYTQQKAGAKGPLDFSLDKLLAESPEYFLFNGRVGALTGAGALHAQVNETVRIYFGVGGGVPSSFHVIGEVFDRVLMDGNGAPTTNRQTVGVPSAGAAIVEFKLDYPGTYVLVDHTLTRVFDRGAAGHLVVEGPADPEVFRAVE